MWRKNSSWCVSGNSSTAGRIGSWPCDSIAVEGAVEAAEVVMGGIWGDLQQQQKQENILFKWKKVLDFIFRRVLIFRITSNDIKWIWVELTALDY